MSIATNMNNLSVVAMSTVLVSNSAFSCDAVKKYTQSSELRTFIRTNKFLPKLVVPKFLHN